MARGNRSVGRPAATTIHQASPPGARTRSLANIDRSTWPRFAEGCRSRKSSSTSATSIPYEASGRSAADRARCTTQRAIGTDRSRSTWARACSAASMPVGAFVVPLAGATRPLCFGQWRAVRPGSENMCKRVLGFPRNLGDPVVSMEEIPDGIPAEQPQARCWAFGGGRNENSRTFPWYRQAKATKCGGTGGRKS